MRPSPILLAAFLLTLAVVSHADAARCRPCVFAGPPSANPSCIANGGLLIFSSVLPDEPASWTLRAASRGRRSRGQLDGRLEVRSESLETNVPGFPRTWRDGFYVGTAARFDGSLQGDRLDAVASYRDGSTCSFALTIGFGVNGRDPNAFVCRDAAGAIVAEGFVDVQGIRLRGCKAPRR